MKTKREQSTPKPLGKRQRRLLELYEQICKRLENGKRYRGTYLSATQIAHEISIRPGDISEAVATHFGDNYNVLVNSFRLRDAVRMLRQSRYNDYSLEEIGLMVGFNSRQAFYNAFEHAFHCTPKQFRDKAAAEAALEKEV